MPVNTTIRRKLYACNGSQVIFPFTFPISAETDLVVKVRTDATGAVTTLTLTTNYTVTKAGANWDSGGNVTTVATYAAGKTLLVKRVTQHTQTKDYIESDDFPAESHEEGLDKLTRLVQELQEELDRSLQMPDTDAENLDMTIPTTVDRASKWLGFDASGQPVAVQTTPSSVTVSLFAETVLDDVDAAAIIATLGLDADIATLALPASTTISAFVKTLLDDADADAVLATLGSDVVLSDNLNMGQGLVDNSDAVDVDGIVEQGTGTHELKVKVVDIGEWDMDTGGDGSATKTVAHGLSTDYKKIRSISVIIRDDNDANYYDLDKVTTGSEIKEGGVSSIDATNITLAHSGRAPGPFDNNVFDTDTSFNRGWVTIWYEV